MAAPRSRPGVSRTLGLRHAWLATLGLVLLARRRSTRLPRRLAGLSEHALGWMDGAHRREALRGRSSAHVDEVPWDSQPEVPRLSSDVQARLQPVLDKLGLRPRA